MTRAVLSRRDEEGFSFLEVMIALAILAIALPVLLGLRNRDVDLHLRARGLMAATLLAQEKLLEAELAGFLPLGEVSGDFRGVPLGFETAAETGDRAPGYRWKRIVLPTPLDVVREVRVQVRWPRGDIEEMIEVSTYVFQSQTL